MMCASGAQATCRGIYHVFLCLPLHCSWYRLYTNALCPGKLFMLMFWASSESFCPAASCSCSDLVDLRTQQVIALSNKSRAARDTCMARLEWHFNVAPSISVPPFTWAAVGFRCPGLAGRAYVLWPRDLMHIRQIIDAELIRDNCHNATIAPKGMGP